MTRNRWTLAVVAGAVSTALIGGVALGSFQPFASSDQTVVGDPTTDLGAKDPPKASLKAILDGLIAKNTITQAQEDAILKALADAQPAPRAVPKPSLSPVTQSLAAPGAPGAWPLGPEARAGEATTPKAMTSTAADPSVTPLRICERIIGTSAVQAERRQTSQSYGSPFHTDAGPTTPCSSAQRRRPAQACRHLWGSRTPARP